ncbi:MAG TPA: hypothetical protein VHQ70_02500 [Syntrophomonadaceae bacterium]|nr:hypothetical protein [Syntrophomonadaceae bacterium]
MSNQALLWGTLIVSWLSLLFMKKENIKRFMPAGLLAQFISIIVTDMGVGYGWWYARETTYPFALLVTFIYGLVPIAMWILNYTYERFWLYVVVDVVANTIFAFFILPWFGSRGIIGFNASLLLFILATLVSFIMYGFQMWQESSVINNFSVKLHSVAAKPLPEEKKTEEDNP